MKNSSVSLTHLPDGLRIISESMPNVRSVAVGIWIRCGSAYETIENNGISHFLEHMLFKGTKNRSARQIAMSLESVGGTLNASTGKELSIYSALVLDEYLPLALEVLSDLVLQPKFSPREIEREKNVVLAEIHHALEDPEDLAIDYLYQNLFYNHPLGYFIYGSASNVQKFCREDLRHHLNTFHTPDRMVVAAAGAVQHQMLVEKVKNFFSMAPSLSHGIEIPPPEHIHFIYHATLPSLQQAHLCLGAKIFGATDPRRYALALLEMLLGGGMSSRLFQNIREKYGFAYSVYSFVDLMHSVGVLGCYMGCDADKIERSLELLQKEFAALRRKPISRSELERLKAQLKGHILLALESSGRRLQRIAEAEIYHGEHLTIQELVKRIDDVTPNELTELAHEYLNDDQLVTVVISPQK